MLSKSQKRKIFIPTIVLGLLLAALLAALVYVKLIGFKKALIELVSTQTEEKYSLRIGKASVHFLSLAFEFDSLVITRNSTLEETGVRQVTVPHLELRVANVISMFRSKKFDIKTLVLDEPRIEIDSWKQEDSLHNKFHLGQQMVQLYPAIESLLERFNIVHLKINKAALGVNYHSTSQLNLGLIDFLIEQWDQGFVNENSQLRLKIGAQELSLEKANIHFSAVEYNFKKRELRLDELSFSTVDSLSKSHVKVTAQALVMNKLGYNDLFKNQKLTYEKVTILNPKVDLHLFLKPKTSGTETETNGKEVVTRIIQQTIGECNIDTLVIEGGDIITVLQKGEDSTIISLPQVNFKLYTFQVIKDSSTFVTGSAHIELNKTSIAITDGISLRCQKLIFDRKQNLIFEDVELFESENQPAVATCRLLSLEAFHLLPLMFDKELLVKNIVAEDAVINIPDENIFGTRGKTKKGGLKIINIGSISLKNVALNYTSNGNSFAANGLSMQVKNLKKKLQSPLIYTLIDIDIADARFAIAKTQTRGLLQNVSFKGNLLQIENAQLKLNDLDILLREVYAVHNGNIENYKNLDYKNWNSVAVQSVALSGTLAEKRQTENLDSVKNALDFTVAQFAVKELLVDVKRGDFSLSFSGQRLAVHDALFTDGQFNYQKTTGKLLKLNFSSKNVVAAVGEVEIAMPEKIELFTVDVLSKQLSFKAPHASIFGLAKTTNGWEVKSAKISALLLKQRGQEVLKTEIITLKNASFVAGKKPFIAFIEAYQPVFTIGKEEENAAKSSTNKLGFLNFFGDFVLHPGTLHLPNQRIRFGKTTGNAKNKTLLCTYLTTDLTKTTLTVKQLLVDKKQIAADSILLVPLNSWYKTRHFAESLVNAHIYQASATGYSLDSLLIASKLENAVVNINGFHLDIFKDFRLPEPAFVEKPASLEGLLKLPKNIDIKTIHLKNGSINVAQISSKTAEKGLLNMTEIWATATLNKSNPNYIKLDLTGSAKLYDQGIIDLKYHTIDGDMFALSASLSDFNMTKFNDYVTPMQDIEIKSGYLTRYDLNIIANNEQAVGDASISYNDLHMIIYKNNDPDKSNLGAEIMNLLADGLILKNGKTNATTTVNQPRAKNKTTFDYWVKTAMQGGLKAIRQGKSQRK